MYVPDQSSYVSCNNHHLKFDLVLMIITPSAHSNNSLSKICSKGWVAQKAFFIGSLTAALRFSKGWIRKDTNLGLRTGCITWPAMPTANFQTKKLEIRSLRDKQLLKCRGCLFLVHRINFVVQRLRTFESIVVRSILVNRIIMSVYDYTWTCSSRSEEHLSMEFIRITWPAVNRRRENMFWVNMALT